MGEFGGYLLDVLAVFGGGRGDPSRDLARFGLGIIFWAALLALAVGRRRRNPQPRESLLIWGFGFGLARELFMFTVKSLQLYGIISPATLELFFPPLEHTLLLITRVVIAAAFLQYFLKSRSVARRFLVVGLVICLLSYLPMAPVWWSEVAADPEMRFSKFWGDWIFHSLGAGLSVAAIVLFLRSRSWIRSVIAIAFGFYLLDDVIMLVNLATEDTYKAIFTPIRHNLHIWAIPVIGYIYIREQREEADRLEAKLQQSERLNAVGQLAAGVAHDFNNHLQVILGCAELALEEEKTDIESLESISLAGERALSLVNQLLAFSRQEEGELTSVNLNDVVVQLTPMLSRLLGAEVRLHHKLDPSIKLVWADPRMIEQIMINLAVNARDAMPEGGIITIKTEVSQIVGDGDTDVAERVLLTVSDTGTGMDAETVSRSFDPFFTTKPVGKGTGLGLSTVYGIVQKHKGSISIDSEPGKGTSIHIELPISTKRGVSTVSDETLVDATGTETILIAEDEYAIRDLLFSILSKAGYKVLNAGNGQNAIDLMAASNNKIDLCLFDVAMPEVNGYQAYDELRQRGINTPVLFMTGNTNRVGGNRSELQHILKPFNRSKILSEVRNALDAVSETTVAE